MSKKIKVFLAVGIAAVFVAAILIIYFVVTRSTRAQSVSVASYDKVAYFTLDTSDDNIISVEKRSVNDIEQVIVKYTDEEKFIQQIKNDPCYEKTFEFANAGGATKTQLLMLSEKYYYIVDVHADNENCAIIKSLFASISVPHIYPIFNSSVYVDFGVSDGVPYGGTQTFTIEEFNANGSMLMNENAFKTYDDLKSYYAKIDPGLYIADDAAQSVGLKVYSLTMLDNGTHYYEGYPVTIQFTEENKVMISYDLNILLAG